MVGSQQTFNDKIVFSSLHLHNQNQLDRNRTLRNAHRLFGPLELKHHRSVLARFAQPDLCVDPQPTVPSAIHASYPSDQDEHIEMGCGTEFRRSRIIKPHVLTLQRTNDTSQWVFSIALKAHVHHLHDTIGLVPTLASKHGRINVSISHCS